MLWAVVSGLVCCAAPDVGRGQMRRCAVRAVVWSGVRSLPKTIHAVCRSTSHHQFKQTATDRDRTDCSHIASAHRCNHLIPLFALSKLDTASPEALVKPGPVTSSTANVAWRTLSCPPGVGDRRWLKRCAPVSCNGRLLLPVSAVHTSDAHFFQDPVSPVSASHSPAMV